MKNKKIIYIVLLQIFCVVITVAILVVFKYFYKDTFLKIKEKHNAIFNEETVVEDISEETVPTAVTLGNTEEINSFCIPVKGVVTSEYGYRNDPFTDKETKHYGTDIAADNGESISAAASGTIVSVGYDENGYGNYLKIAHSQTITTLYGHCSKVTVKEGDFVEKGQTVAKVGNTGRSTGAHLHFEILVNGTPVNAMWYMEF